MYKRKNKRPELCASLKVKVVRYFDKHGLVATIEMFQYSHNVRISKSTIYNWKKEVDRYDNKGMLFEKLNPISRKPKAFRQSKIDLRVIDFVIRQRHKNPIIGKDKLHLMLCIDEDFKDIIIPSKSSIGNLLKRLKDKKLVPISKADYDLNINGKTGKIESREIKSKLRKKKSRRPREHKPKAYGEIVQIDAIAYFIGRVKKYIICAVDLKTRISYAKVYDKLNSSNAKDTLEEFKRVYKINYQYIQTDNGLEFHRYFDEYLTEENIKHYWNYPRSPKMNAFIERFNRTIQEEFLDWRVKSLRDLKCSEFNQLLFNYLHYYNNERPHHSLQLNTPMKTLEILRGNFPECM